MPRIELSEVFGGTVPEGIDAEKTGAFLDEKIEALLKAEGDGVRSSEQTNIKERDEKIELLTAELEDLRTGTTGKEPAATEPGSKAAEIRARQQQSKAEAAQQAAINKAVGDRDNFWKATLEAKSAGIPESIIERSGGNAEKLADLTVMYQELGGKAKTETKQGSGILNSNNDNSTVTEEPKTSIDRVANLVAKMPMATLSGGQQHDLSQ